MSTPSDLHSRVTGILDAAGLANSEQEAAAIVAAATRQGDGGRDARALAMAGERAKGTPLAYVTGQVVFMGVEVMTSPGALIPRHETELLGMTALAILKREPGASGCRAIDMCCGSGNLTCALAVHDPSVQIWASDLSEEAVAVARANVARLGLAGRVNVSQGDLFQALTAQDLQGAVDMVVCNPPYISTGKLGKERADLLSFEPRQAFDGGPYGVSIFQGVARDAVAYLRPGGHLLFEVGVGQAAQVALILTRTGAYSEVRTVDDHAGTPRVVMGTKKHA